MDAERRWVRRSRAGAVLVAVLMNGLGRGAASAEEGANPQATASAAQGTSRDPEGILNLDLDQLAKTPVAVGSGIAMNEPVTSVTKEASTIGKSAAAVFVITNKMIRRSGAKCIPEALRMAPGLEVAQVNSNAWAITCRGFNGGLADKLLVLIDGRTVYTPVFGGVYWDIQDVLLEDVDRIEVIRGPGGTLWGSNAVNGVINIITKNAKDTQGVYLNAGGGTVERSTGAFRYGGKIGDDCQYRVYGKYFDDGPFIGQDFSFFGPPTQRPDTIPGTKGTSGSAPIGPPAATRRTALRSRATITWAIREEWASSLRSSRHIPRHFMETPTTPAKTCSRAGTTLTTRIPTGNCNPISTTCSETRFSTTKG